MIQPGSSEGRLILTNRMGTQQGIAFVEIAPPNLALQQNKDAVSVSRWVAAVWKTALKTVQSGILWNR